MTKWTDRRTDMLVAALGVVAQALAAHSEEIEKNR
jgi:hypothetical protein